MHTFSSILNLTFSLKSIGSCVGALHKLWFLRGSSMHNFCYHIFLYTFIYVLVDYACSCYALCQCLILWENGKKLMCFWILVLQKFLISLLVLLENTPLILLVNVIYLTKILSECFSTMPMVKFSLGELWPVATKKAQYMWESINILNFLQVGSRNCS